MKLKTKIYLLAILPMAVLSLVLFLVASRDMEHNIYEESFRGMNGTALAVRSAFEAENEGKYMVDEAGEMWKGDINISKLTQFVDSISGESKVEISVFYGDTRYLTSIMDESGKRQVGTTASQEVSSVVLGEGKEYRSTKVQVLGMDYLGFYLPLFQEGSKETVGMVFVGTPRDIMIGEVRSMQTRLLLIIAVFLLFASLGIGMVARVLMVALSRSIDLIHKMGTGDLTASIDEKLMKRPDDIGRMMQSLDGLLQKIRGIISDVKENSDALQENSASMDQLAASAASALEQVDRAVMEIADGATSQAGHTQDAEENVSLMGTMVLETNQETEALNKDAAEIEEASQIAEDAVKQLESTTVQVKEAIGEIYEETLSTNASVQKISEVTSLITSIASQTNLLSLNASIEAARAGEHGRGFAVVASEIQQLAAQSNQSAAEIQGILRQLMENSNQAVAAMNRVKEIVELQEKNVENTGAEFAIVQRGIAHSAESIKSIARKSEELDLARNSTVSIVESLAAIAEQNAAATEETASAIDEVTELVKKVEKDAKSLGMLSEKLHDSVSVFKI